MQNIKTLITKELKSYFDHPAGYVFLVIFLVVSNYFFYRTIMFSELASTRPLFDLMPWLMLFLVPAVTMKLFAEERKSGTWEILLTQPLSELSYVVGKWLSAVAFFAIALALLLPVPLTLSIIGDFDTGQIFAQFLGALLFAGALSALGACASQLTKNQIIAFLLSLAGGFFFIIAGMDFVTLSLPSAVRTVFENLSLTGHYFSLTRGVLDIRDLLYFISFIAIFLSLTYLLVKRPRVNTGKKEWRTFQTGITGIIIIAVLINLFGHTIRGRIDFTADNLYTLSPASKNIVGNLDDLVTLSIYKSEELPAEIAAVERDVDDLVKDLVAAGKGNLTLNTYTPDHEDFEASVQRLGIPSVQFNVVRQDEFQVKQGYFGLAIEYAGDFETLPFIDNTANLEYLLVSGIKKLTDEEVKVVGFLTGSGEKSIQSDYATLVTNLREQYEVREIDLANEETALEELTGLVIAGSNSPLSPEALQKIQNFSAGGGSLMVLADKVLITPQTLSAQPNPSNVFSLLDDYGLSVNTNLALDLRSNESITFGGGLINYILPYPFWMRTVANPDHPTTKNLQSLLVPWASTISVTETEGIAVDSLIQTTQFGHLQREGEFNLSPDQQFQVDQSALGTHIIGVAAHKSGESRLILVGDSDFLTEQFTRTSPTSLAFALNSIDWLIQDESLIEIRSKNRVPAPLRAETDAQRSTIKYLNLIGIPLLVVLFGAGRIYLRRRKMTMK